MSVNKIQLSNGDVLIDLTDANVTADEILIGASAYNQNGVLLEGTLEMNYNGQRLNTLPTGTNLNRLDIDPGDYYYNTYKTDSSGNAIDPTDIYQGTLPTENRTVGLFQVIKVSDSLNFTIQRCVPYTGRVIYQRCYTNSQWYAWRQFAGSEDYYTKDEIDAKIGNYITSLASVVGGDA